MSAADEEHEDDLLAPVFYDAPPAEDAEIDAPLAPPVYEDEAHAAVPDEEPLAPGVDGLDEEFPEESDGGFSDQQRIVCVWVSEGRLTKVRLSTSWHRRLGKRSLSDAFAQALLGAAVHTEDLPQTVADPEGFTDDDLPDTSFDSLEVLVETMRDLGEREAEIRRAVGERPGVEARSQGVTVGLDERGLPMSVGFDPDWLENAQSSEIADRVVRCAAQAQDRFAAEGGDGGLGEVLEASAWVSSVMKRMLSVKEDAHV